jgi:hypothetical protein
VSNEDLLLKAEMANAFKHSAAHPSQSKYGEQFMISFNELAHAAVPPTDDEFGSDVVRNGHYKKIGIEIVFLYTPDQA